ncbi:MAG: ATP-binding SpoIIE family protein phosphatase [Nitrospiraceae bacterium]
MTTDQSVGEQISVPTSESSQVADVRRRIAALAGQVGFDETRAGVCAVIATEIGTNLVKHAKEGEIFLRTLSYGSSAGIEILALDRGPGMGNLNRALQDGHSTAGTSGNGLGAIGRMASEFDIHSMPGRGTALVARIWNSDALHTRESRPTVTGVVSRAMPGETVSGDGWLYHSSDRRTVCAIADGLGHGLLAAQASTCAIESLRAHGTASLLEQIDRAHLALRATRGVALGVAEIQHDQRIVTFSGIGNIMAAVIQNGTIRNMVSQNGILGHQIGRVTEFQYPWSPSAILIMCSDGISTRWDLKSYEGLMSRDSSLIAAVLYRDFARGRDDATVIVFKHATERPSLTPS